MKKIKSNIDVINPGRRTLMDYALKGGVVAGLANMTIVSNLFAQ
jgi:hypothetical protein